MNTVKFVTVGLTLVTVNVILARPDLNSSNVYINRKVINETNDVQRYYTPSFGWPLVVVLFAP